jgi:hypothetical protein
MHSQNFAASYSLSFQSSSTFIFLLRIPYHESQIYYKPIVDKDVNNLGNVKFAIRSGADLPRHRDDTDRLDGAIFIEKEYKKK